MLSARECAGELRQAGSQPGERGPLLMDGLPGGGVPEAGGEEQEERALGD